MKLRYDKSSYPNRAFRHYLAHSRYLKIYNLLKLHLKKGGAILDLGCGQGEYLKGHYPKDSLVVGCDVEYLALQNRIGNFNPVQGSAEKTPFKEESFDVILFSEVLEHLPNPDKALDEIGRIIKHKGSLIISTPLKNSIYEKQMYISIRFFIIYLIQKLCRRPLPQSDHISLHSADELKQKLTERSLTIQKEYFTGFCLPFSVEVLDFLFKFKQVMKLYAKLDNYVNHAKPLRTSALNWIMILCTEKN